MLRVQFGSAIAGFSVPGRSRYDALDREFAEIERELARRDAQAIYPPRR
jgi:hypothetical protein